MENNETVQIKGLFRSLSCAVPERLITEAVRFHGHLGAFLVLGLKAGLFANKVLGKDHFKTRAVVETEPFPPCSCVVDGVQIATGCTLGKGNIELKKGDFLSVTFIKGNEKIKLCLKEDVLKRLRRSSSMEEAKRTALTLVDQPVHELFDIENNPASC
ncbi:MAG: formylmethanofuran dehydrogenase subunit E family protein [Candidatus Bathyarchaeota archaeon]|nr:formylmethanofuran dehydrogenase subunit E family protein [Candidatus Bathyarchaeota archaeon]